MAFFNKKEEVMNFELTPYGRYLLANGELEPVYYEFCDEEIIYDNAHADVSEELKDAQNRLKNEHIKTRESVNIFSCDKAKTKDYSAIDYTDNHSTLGSSEISSKYAPAWSIHALSGEISSAVQGTNSGTKKHTQIDFSTGSFEIRTTYDEEEYTNDLTVSDIFEDDSFLKVNEEFLFIEIIENNTENLLDNFDIEFFEIKYDKDGNETLQQFDPNEDNYFDILVDGEIDPEFYCKYRRNDTSDNFYTKIAQKCATKSVKQITGVAYDNIITKDTDKC